MDYSKLEGMTLLSADGSSLGKIKELYLDDDSSQPKWVTVTTGLFGTKSSFIPLEGAQETEDGLKVPYDKELITGAPNVDADEVLSEEQESLLYQHYNQQYDREYPLGETSDGHDTSGPDTDNAMTRSEEELVVSTRDREVSRARLRKYLVTEQVQKTVPVTHEEVRIEREPINGDNLDRATDGPALSEEEHEVVLHAEEPVIDKQVVPKERVSLGKESVQTEHTVQDEVRKEHIDLDEDAR